ncbi:MAG: HemY protein [Candidatus Tokpelaia sp. JSC189]|nr:MAG: HemY protein [Candidatus Tokpelaia sp. JSC189]
MVRVLLYFLLVVMIGAGFAWLADFPGELVMTVRYTHVTVSLLAAVTGVLASFFCLLVIWWLLRYIIFGPLLLKRHVQAGRRDRGYQLVCTGLFAAFAGDVATARHMARKSGKLLGCCKEPLLSLLESQINLLDLDDRGAVRFFEKMRKNPQTQLLALRGLFQEAVKSGVVEAGNQYAQEALQINPCLKWANTAIIQQLASEGKWRQAIALFEKYAKSQPRSVAASEKFMHLRTVLMTGQAQDLALRHPKEVRQIALKAHKLQPSFVPAANIAAGILFHLGEIRKGSRLIEAMWKKTPHPDLGFTYVNAGYQYSSAVDRLKRARQLAKFNLSNRESQILVAWTALEAGELAFARKNAMEAAKTLPTRNTFLLLADIESAQTGDQGKIRNWLTEAVQAEPDMAWIADGISLVEWSPCSPVTGYIGTCEWKAPAKRRHFESYRGKSTANGDQCQGEGEFRSLIIDLVASTAEDAVLPWSRKSSAERNGPVISSNIDVETAACRRIKRLDPVTCVVDDPGVSDDDGEEDTSSNKFRLF